MHTVELLVDPALDGLVRSVWQRLHAAGLPSLATHAHPTNRPHLTLAAADRLTPEVGAALAGLPVGATLDGLIFFERAVVWRVTLTDALRDLHARVWRALEGTERNPQHAPGSWVPHVSLALRGGDQPRYAAELRDLPAARGSFRQARTYDSGTRAVTPLS
ncbi:2'-5' RNA ligase family protein [Actinoplanes sp. NPDC049599]|uniref:2'-5' RNA ligase family protein n=1 Tax=Actinoplanes sp. NPDC049599 TaxID=3363903 RepID=UPI0037A0233C